MRRISPKRGIRWSATIQVSVALFSGLLIGLAVSASRSSKLAEVAAALETIGTIWINAIRMTVIPLVVSLLFVSMTSFPDVRTAGRTGARALLVFAALLMGSAAFAVLTVPSAFTWLETGGTPASLGQNSVTSELSQQAHRLPNLAQWLVDAVPANPIHAAADGTMLPLVVFAIAFGLAATHIDAECRGELVTFFRAVSEAMLALVRWLIKLAPVGVFCLIVPLAARLGTSAAGVFGSYVAVLTALLCILTLALYPIAVVFGRVSVRRFVRAAFPAQTIAFSSRSSLASLAALIEGAELGLPCPPAIAGFIVPLAVSIFKVTTPVVWLSNAYFVARLYGVHLGGIETAQIVAASFLLSFCTPGIPMGSFIMLAPVFSSVGLPVEGIGLLMAVDLVPDIFKTIANVTGYMAATAVLSRRARPSCQ